jgi:Tfp pilus assembly protein PilF
MLERGQDTALLRFSLGNEYRTQEDNRSAAIHLEEAVRLDPKYSAAWKLLGKVLTDLNEPSRAAEIYTQGIAVAEKSGDRQAAKEMAVFLRRIVKTESSSA